jgi:hypothetical protein
MSPRTRFTLATAAWLAGCAASDESGDDAGSSDQTTADVETTAVDDGPGSTASTPGDADAGTTDGDTTTGPARDASTGAETSGGEDTGPAPLDCTPFPEAVDFAAAGPFGVMQEAGGPDCTIFRPAQLGDNGLRHPVILWGNGTATTPPIYGGVLTHWASHGFVVAAANTTNAGTGLEMLACLDWLTAQDADGTTPYAGVLDLDHVGTSGHSQGGGGALMAGQDPRIVATAPLQPYTEQGFGGYDQACQGNQHAPMFLMSGDADTIATPVPNQQRVFDDTTVPTLWGTLAGGNHIFTAIGNINGYRGPATAWLRHHLMCDEAAGALFYGACTLCSDPAWDVQTKNW